MTSRQGRTLGVGKNQAVLKCVTKTAWHNQRGQSKEKTGSSEDGAALDQVTEFVFGLTLTGAVGLHCWLVEGRSLPQSGSFL